MDQAPQDPMSAEPIRYPVTVTDHCGRQTVYEDPQMLESAREALLAKYGAPQQGQAPLDTDTVPQITEDDVRDLLGYAAHLRRPPVLIVEYDHNNDLQLQILSEAVAPLQAVVTTYAEMRVFLDAAGIDPDDPDADWGDLMLVLQDRVIYAAHAVMGRPEVLIVEDLGREPLGRPEITVVRQDGWSTINPLTAPED